MEGYSNIVAYIVGKSFYYPLKIFRRDWLAPIPLLILHDQLALTKIGRCEQYTIDDIFDWKRDCVGSRPSINIVSLQARPSSWLRCEWNEKKKRKKNGVQGYPGLSKDEIARIRKTHCSMDFIYFWGVSCKKRQTNKNYWRYLYP